MILSFAISAALVLVRPAPLDDPVLSAPLSRGSPPVVHPLPVLVLARVLALALAVSISHHF